MTSNNALWKALFRNSAAKQPSPDRDHPVDDDELLARFSAGMLTDDEQQALIAHLADCSACRDEWSQRVDAGAISLPAPPETAPSLAPRTIKIGQRYVIAAVAACMLIAAIAGYWAGLTQSPLAQLENQVRLEQYDAAVETAGQIRWDDLSDVDREQAYILVESAAYQASLQHLGAGRFDRVQTIVQQTDRLGLQSAQLQNLKLQAMRKIPAEYALAFAFEDSQLDYGYLIDGAPNPRKSLPTLSEETDQLENAYAELVDRYPDAAPLRINFGQFLLRQGDVEFAGEQFYAALQADPISAEALLGLGMADYALEDFLSAKVQFEDVLEAEPGHLAARVNLAMTLQQLNDRPAALQQWRLVRNAVRGENRDQVDEQIQRLQE